MAPKYVLNYFDVWGTAEPIRLILHYAKVEFTDNRVKKEDWPAMKPKTPFGQLPTLEVDGKVINQSCTICRYLGREFGLAGSDNWEAAEIDAVVDNANDLRQQFRKVFEMKDPEEKKKMKETLLTETVPFAVSRLEKRLKNNNGYIVNGKLSWGDIYLVHLMDLMEDIISEDLKKTAVHALALRKKVHELPGIKEWIAKRAPNSFSAAKLLE
ncbi:glutathione S-transferase [Anabrus simplex]|uniref:glutathione S-transferase n=1 Tax=Anabrus simplex TaxID=316456 RepID=UPI0035A33E83